MYRLDSYRLASTLRVLHDSASVYNVNSWTNGRCGLTIELRAKNIIEPQDFWSIRMQLLHYNIIITYTVGLKVNLRYLHLLKWRNTNGDYMQTKIIDRVCHKWKDIAPLLSKNDNTVPVLSQRYQNDPSQCVQQVFLDCFISNEPDHYSQDWNGIIELLKDIQEEVLSEEVKNWLEMQWN